MRALSVERLASAWLDELAILASANAARRE